MEKSLKYADQDYPLENRCVFPHSRNEIKTVLIIEYEKLVRDSLAEIMFQVGVPVLTAANGAAGLELYQKHADEVGLVFLDYAIPGMNGEKFFHELRKLNPCIKVILSSCYIDLTIVNRLQKEEHFDFLPKPFGVKKFLEKLDLAFDRGRLVNASVSV